ncbi:MAG TPA: 2'-5' RNA ligase family protein [Flavisolibacter sp.]|jgi:2'-5' RNA ligase|nr:2'-5' RNA ligase family protein [Flavisolibacter sp.]
MVTLYFIAVVLPEELNQKMLLLKQQLFDRYGCRVGLKSPAHITLQPPFRMDTSLEPLLINSLDSVSEEQETFELTLNGFSAFRPRTLFAAILPEPALTALKLRVDAYFKARTQLPVKIDTRPFHPHITVATRDLTKAAFYEVWPEFEQKEWSDRWEVTGLSLLRHNQKNWDVIHTSQFHNV